MIEREHQRKAFEIYYRLGSKRSLGAVAQKTGYSVTAVKKWSARFHWRDRLGEREKEVSRAMADETIQASAIGPAQRNRKLITLAVATIAKQLAEGRVRTSISDLDRLIRLESFLDGQADSRQEIVGRELAGKTGDELRAMLRRELAELSDLAGEAAQ